jgi:cysteine desulfurase
MVEAYLDNNATTPLLPAVLEVVVDALQNDVANPSSKHRLGRASRRLVEEARAVVASAIGAEHPSEVIFTSSATEAIFQAIASAADRVKSIVTGAADHSAVQAAAAAAAASKGGRRHSKALLLSTGLIDTVALAPQLSHGEALLSATLVNNETGVIEDIGSIRALCQRHGALLHVDGAQAFGKVPVDVRTIGCDYLTLSPHKFHGPKGVGILYARKGVPCSPLFPGHQEFGLRAGTENVAAIAGAGAAVRAGSDSIDHQPRIAALRDKLEKSILAAIPTAVINGSGVSRVANTTNLSFVGRNAAELVSALSRRGVYVSAASACSTRDAPSHVLLAMGLGDERATGSVRFSLSRLTLEEEIDFAIEQTLAVYAGSLSFHG